MISSSRARIAVAALAILASSLLMPRPAVFLHVHQDGERPHVHPEGKSYSAAHRRHHDHHANARDHRHVGGHRHSHHWKHHHDPRAPTVSPARVELWSDNTAPPSHWHTQAYFQRGLTPEPSALPVATLHEQVRERLEPLRGNAGPVTPRPRGPPLPASC
jgi:hypothetical protein